MLDSKYQKNVILGESTQNSSERVAIFQQKMAPLV